MKKKRRQTVIQNDGERFLRYGVRLFLRNKEVDAITIENHYGSISLRRREIEKRDIQAIGFGCNFEENDDYYEEDKRKARARRFK